MKNVSVTLFIIGIFYWFSPGFNGFLFDPFEMTPGESRIIAAILIVAGFYFWNQKKK